MPEAGEKAPEFELKNQRGETIRLRDYKGKKVGLYFYPKDNTPGCTKQGCSIRNSSEALKKKGITVFGVSMDGVESHAVFAKKQGFDFPILSDEKGEVCRKYGVIKEKSMFGNTFLGIKRTTFLIDEKGLIKAVIRKPDVNDHANEIIAGFGKYTAKSE